MTKKSIVDLREFARFTFKTYQDVMHAALMKDDIQTLKTVAMEFNKAFGDQFDNAEMLGVRVDGLKFQLEHPQPGDNRGELEALLHHQSERLDASKNLRLAKAQIFFGLSSRALELYLAERSERKREAVELFMGYLPAEMPKLMEVFSSISDDRASDMWGWHWWDFQPDGEAHMVDSFTRPNRMFIVRALQILPNQGNAVPAVAPLDNDNLFLFDENNGQGVPSTLNQVDQNWDQYAAILTDENRQRIAVLRTLLQQMKAAGEAARERKLIEAPLDPVKVQKFKENVTAAFNKSSRIRKLFAKLSKYNDRSGETAPDGLRSWGYNQLDEKGAFIADWHVHYGSWGEAYGRGLAQAENNRAFASLLKEAHVSRSIKKENIILEISKTIGAKRWNRPIVLQTLRHTLEYGRLRNQESFVPVYSRDFPATPEAELDGFIGLLKVGTDTVPIFDIFAQSEELKNKILVVDLAKYAEWDHYLPVDNESQRGDLFGLLQIKVADLNADDDRRNKIILENPSWLQEKGDIAEKEKFLRSRVVVNVYDKFAFSFLNREAAVCLSVSEDIEE